MMKNFNILSIFLFAGFSVALIAYPPKDCPSPRDGHHMPFAFMDTNKDSKISQEEWLAHFKEVDANNDGSIDDQEMDKHHQSMRDKRQEEMHKQMHENMKK